MRTTDSLNLFRNTVSKKRTVFELPPLKKKMMIKGCAFVLVGLMLLMAVPVCMGLAGGLLGMVAGIIGGIFGMLAGLLGALFGIIGALLKGFFHLIFGWSWADAFSGSSDNHFWVVLIIVVVVAFAFKNKNKS
ncbi:MAG: hypothetical protein JST69_03995 [Bacteroidetes bacterium]|nr:hypothetical protein [Bacteroidota bacterium]